MKPPKCKLCNQEHWNHEAHKFPRAEMVETPEASKPDRQTDAGSTKGVVGQVQANRRWRTKNKERYNAYMKDFMRKDRAAKARGREK